MTPAALAEHCQATLEPLEAEVNRAWWDANTEASDEHQRRRAAAELAMSDALADTETFAAIRAARSDRTLGPEPARMLALLEQAYAPHQADPDLRRRIVELQSSIDARFARHRRDHWRPSHRRQRDPRHPPHQRRRRAPAGRVGGVQERRTGCCRRRPSARSAS